jgi:hypothetical protein
MTEKDPTQQADMDSVDKHWVAHIHTLFVLY